jgi:hypothetical protein
MDLTVPQPQQRSLWREAFCQRSVWLRALRLGTPVGMLQSVINQGDVWLHHQQTLETVIKTVASPAISTTLVLVSAAATWVQKTEEENL